MITDKKILVVDGFSYANTVASLGEVTMDITEFIENPDDFSLVMFTGGSDVSPELYGDTSPKGFCGNNRPRDDNEIVIFNHALDNDIKITGICRGSQFINVMSGGKMMHHIENHNIGGVHPLVLSNPKIATILVNSYHHQMIIPPDNGHIIGWCGEKRSDIYVGDKDKLVKWDKPETEIILVPETKCCGVQYHPETMPKESNGFKFYQQLMTDFLLMEIDDFTTIYTGEKDDVWKHAVVNT